MGSSVLQRKMFMRPPAKKASGGILSLVEDEMEMEEGQDNFKDRRPDNIEIIANNLRGDIRSMDERYLELAQMVGEAAFDTPEEVLALMQPQLQQQMAQQMPPAANSPSPQGMQQISQGVPQGAPPTPPGAPGAPMAPQQPPGGIESLVADQGAEAAPQQPMAQEPVQRSQGTPLREAMAGGEGSFKTGQELQINISGVGSQPLSAYRASPAINFGDVSNVKLDAMPQTDFGLGITGELNKYFESGGSPETLLSILAQNEKGTEKKEDDLGIASLKKKELTPAEMFAHAAKGLEAAGYGRDAGEEAMKALGKQQRLQGVASPWVRKRAKGSPREAERVTPYLSDVARNIPITDSREPRLGSGVRIPGVYPSDDQYYSGEGMARSRPLTNEEIIRRMQEREARNMSPATRRFYSILRGMGIEPELYAPKVRKALDTINKLPGVGKVGKVLGKIDPADAAIAVTGGAAVGYGARNSPTGMFGGSGDGVPKPPLPGPGVVPTLPNLPDGSPSMANPIPPIAGSFMITESMTPIAGGSGSGGGGNIDGGPPNRQSDAADQVAIGPVGPDVDLPTDDTAIDTGVDTGPADRRSDEVDRVALGPLGQQPGESKKDFAARVRERANLYKELLGEDESTRKAKAYFLLAEAGLALAGARGRNMGERLAIGLKGLPSGMGKLAAEKTAVDRAATSAAISAIEQQDRDEARNIASLKAAALKAGAPKDRDYKIRSLATVYGKAYGMDEATALQMATLKVDGALPEDELGNERIGSTNGRIVTYGPSNQPIRPDNPAFIDANYPFQIENPTIPTPVMEPKQMSKLVEENQKLTTMLGQLQRAKMQLSDKIGPLNVLQRGISKATVPWIGDLGPFRADEATTYVLDDLNKIIRGYKSVNADGGRVSNWEMQNNQSLEINTGSFFTAPAIELRKVIAMETEIINQIQQNKFRLNPRDSQNVYRQLAVPPSGSKNDPIPSSGFSTLGQYFSVMPGTTVYMKYALPNGQSKVVGITKKYYEEEVARQQQQQRPAAQ